MRILLISSSAAILILITGCDTATFTPYVGEQQAWPTSTGALADQCDGITIYRSGRPPRPYSVIGAVDLKNPSLQDVADQVKLHNGTAAVRIDSTTLHTGTRSNGGSATYSQAFGDSAAISFEGDSTTTRDRYTTTVTYLIIEEPIQTSAPKGNL